MRIRSAIAPLFVLFAVGSTASADSVAQIVKSKKWDKCKADVDCDTVSERDQCSFVAVAARHSTEPD